MNDLFSQLNMTVALHKPSQTEVIIKCTEWYKGQIHYDCLIPQKDEKGRWYFCNATYSDAEIDTSKRAEKGLRIEIEQNKMTT